MMMYKRQCWSLYSTGSNGGFANQNFLSRRLRQRRSSMLLYLVRKVLINIILKGKLDFKRFVDP